jgi:hypothetical protein
MPNHGGNQGGRPSKLTPETLEGICTAVAQGCYETVAAGKAGVGRFALYLWRLRGRNEADRREERRLRGEPGDEPASIYEELYVRLEQAKATARFSAETRVFQSMPAWWLKNGFPREDWRPSNAIVRGVVDELMALRYTEPYASFLAGGDPSRPPDAPPPAPPPTPEEAEHDELMRLANPTNAQDRADMRQHVARCPICRANAVTGTVEWTDRRWAAVLGPIVPARSGTRDDIAELAQLEEQRRVWQRGDAAESGEVPDGKK